VSTETRGVDWETGAVADPVRDYLAAQQRALVAGERLLVVGDRAGVHPSRVAVRRSRSTLRTFACCVPDEPRVSLDTALRAHAQRLGEVRDLEVLADVLAERAEGPLASWIAEHIDQQLTDAWEHVRGTLADVTPGELQARFTAAVAELVPCEGEELERLAARAGRRALRRLRRAGDDAELLHDARKAAKRARYAAELVGDREAAGRFERIQGVLGDHHDLVVARSWLAQAPVPPVLLDEARGLVVRLEVAAAAVLELRIP
jgi:CHAD domain-containing protein